MCVKKLVIEACIILKRVLHEGSQVQKEQTAAIIGGEGDLTARVGANGVKALILVDLCWGCLLYTSDAADE